MGCDKLSLRPLTHDYPLKALHYTFPAYNHYFTPFNLPLINKLLILLLS